MAKTGVKRNCRFHRIPRRILLLAEIQAINLGVARESKGTGNVELNIRAATASDYEELFAV
jgi:hypothetical protein